MLQKSKLIKMVLEYLKHQKVLSALGKDILSTVNTYNENPFDRKGAEQKIIENNNHHSDIFLLIRSTPGIVNKPFSKVSDDEVKNNLYMQIETMCIKEQALIAGK